MSNALPAAEDRAEYQISRPSFPLSDVDQASIVRRYLNGEQVQAMAREFGVSHQAMYLHLLKDEEQWKQAQAVRAMAEYEEAKEGLRTAGDALALARARDTAKCAQWELERVLRRIYGEDKAQIAAVQVNITMDFTSNAAVLPTLSTGEEKDITPK